MDKMEFTSEEKARMVQKLKMYFREELDQELGGFQAEFLIDFFAESNVIFERSNGDLTMIFGM